MTALRRNILRPTGLTACLVAVVALSSACGNGRIVCGGTPIADLHAAGFSGPIAVDGPETPLPPTSWTTRKRGHLTVLAPPATPDNTFVIDTPEKDGTTCVTWNGAPFGHAPDAGELGELDVKPGHDVDLADATAQGFAPFPLAGAERALARIVQQPFRDGGNTLVPHQQATGLEAVIAGEGHVYRVSMELAPGRVGITEARQVLAALRLQ